MQEAKVALEEIQETGSAIDIAKAEAEILEAQASLETAVSNKEEAFTEAASIAEEAVEIAEAAEAGAIQEAAAAETALVVARENLEILLITGTKSQIAEAQETLATAETNVVETQKAKKKRLKKSQRLLRKLLILQLSKQQ